MLIAVDEGLERILATLKEAGTLDRTVVIVTSNHGYFYGEHGLNDERRLAYEESARIPLIVRYPPLAKAGATHKDGRPLRRAAVPPGFAGWRNPGDCGIPYFRPSLLKFRRTNTQISAMRMIATMSQKKGFFV